jgi:CRISPR/Cas system-associated exonuclease Cas4 (RecB family)
MKIQKPLRISPSALDNFFQCSMRYKWTVIDELVPDAESDNLFAVFGTTFHKVMQLNDNFALTEKELVPIWKYLFLAYMSDALYLPKNIEYQDFIDQGKTIIKNGLEMKQRWQRDQVLANEIYFRLDYPNDFFENTFISGRIDTIIKANRIFTALDWKTSKTTDKDIDENDQLCFYIYYVHITYGIDYESIFGALAYPHSKEILFTQRNEQSINKLKAKINLMLSRIFRNDFHKEPKESDGWLIGNCHFCNFKEYCKSHEC